MSVSYYYCEVLLISSGDWQDEGSISPVVSQDRGAEVKGWRMGGVPPTQLTRGVWECHEYLPARSGAFVHIWKAKERL